MVGKKEGTELTNFGQGAQVNIDISSADAAAKAFDFQGRDLMVHVDYEFPVETAVNFVTIDPVLFGTQAFTEVSDVATLDPETGVFMTVDGFESNQFDKILTPEANKVISDDLVAKTLAPSQFSYGGLGVFQFPLRLTTKLRVTLLMRDPVSNVYERLYVLMQETITKKNSTTYSKKSGLF